MTKTEAESVIKGEKQITDFFTDFSRDSQPEEVEKEPETGGNTGNPGEENSQIPENDSNAGNEDTDQGPEKPEESKVEKKKPFTPIEKQRHAFKVEKNKRREVEAQLKAREDEIAKLKEQLEKYKDLTLEDFKGDTGAYTDYKVDQRLGKEQVDRWSAEIENQRRQMDLQVTDVSNVSLMKLKETNIRNSFKWLKVISQICILKLAIRSSLISYLAKMTEAYCSICRIAIWLLSLSGTSFTNLKLL